MILFRNIPIILKIINFFLTYAVRGFYEILLLLRKCERRLDRIDRRVQRRLRRFVRKLRKSMTFNSIAEVEPLIVAPA